MFVWPPKHNEENTYAPISLDYFLEMELAQGGGGKEIIKQNNTLLKVKDDNASVNYMLSDLSVINKPPQLKNVPEFELRLKVDSTFIKKFIAGKKALSETDSFTVLSDGESVKIVIGYSSINTNRVTIPAESENYVDIENVSFNANLFSDVLTANGECESATLEISSQGLGRINFKVDDYDVTYWLVATTTVD